MLAGGLRLKIPTNLKECKKKNNTVSFAYISFLPVIAIIYLMSAFQDSTLSMILQVID